MGYNAIGESGTVGSFKNSPQLTQVLCVWLWFFYLSKKEGENMEINGVNGEVIEVFENNIDMYLKLFCEEQNIEDIKKESQSVWNGALRYIRRHVFNNKDLLKEPNNIYNTNNSIASNYNMYNYELVNNICDIYIDLCFINDKEVSILGFSNLTGIDNETINVWGNNNNKLSSLAFGIYKKLNKFREESLSNKLATGNKNPVGVLAILNRHYSWNLPGVSREQAKPALTDAELPQLHGEIIQHAQIEQKSD